MASSMIENESDGVPVYYSNLESDFGFYRSTPDNSAYICLSDKLLEGNKSFHSTVYQTLITFHKSLEAWDRVVPIVQYFKQLAPPEALPMPEPEIVIIGKAIRLRSWSFTTYKARVSNYRLVGDKAG